MQQESDTSTLRISWDWLGITHRVPLACDDSGTVVLRGARKRRPLRDKLAEEELFVAEFFDGVAESGGFFEFEFLGGFAHVGFELGDVGVELRPGW